jgi:spermidine/putrescine ABC transporter ATP-binding subunit
MENPMNSSFLAIEGVTKRFGDFTALDNVTLDIQRGEFFSLLGPSGCGKTTLLRMLAGFETPTMGDIRLDGELCTHVAPNARPTNLVFQSYALFPHLTVAGNVAYGLRTRNLSAMEKKKLVRECIELVKLGEFAQRMPHQLSGGQRQRVALARALARAPKVLLLDEPLSALDKQLREQMQMELRALQRRVGITFVLVTHDQEEALTMSDRIAVMSRGKVLQVAGPTTLYESPVSREVAAFIGTMNFLPGRISAVTEGKAVLDAGLAAQIAARHDFGRPGAKVGEAAVIAIRPEKLEIGRIATAGKNSLTGRIAAAAYLGDRRHVFVTVPGLDQPLTAAVQNSHRSTGRDFSTSDEVVVSWSIEDSLLLPPSEPWNA